MKYSYFLVFLTVFFSIQTHAADDGDWWLQREIQLQQNREDYARRVYGRSARSFVETDPVTAKSNTITKIAIAEASPTASKVGSSMLKRVAFYAKNPGVQMVGVYAVTQLIEAIGWVMDEGTYVKKRKVDPDNNQPYAWRMPMNNLFYSSAAAACSAFNSYINPKWTLQIKNVKPSSADCFLYEDSTFKTNVTVYYEKNPKYDPNNQQIETFRLTPEQLGAAMMGEGYVDPVDPTIDAKVNTGRMDPSVAAAYEHAGNGVGDELANDMDEKLKNAPPTADGKAAPFGDPRYKTPPTLEKPNSNDRSWRDDGAAADGKAEPIKDPEGNPTGAQSITLKFPVFCEWAFTVCKWYDDWKKTDEWLRDSPKKSDSSQQDIDDKGIFNRTFDTVFSLSKDCPPDIPFELDAYYFKGSYTISMRWLCIIFTALGYPLVFLSHCTGIWILYETVIRKEIKA